MAEGDDSKEYPIGACFFMDSNIGCTIQYGFPQVAREAGNRIGRVEEVEGQRRQDELN